MFFLGFLQFSSVLFLSKYFDFVGFSSYTLLTITICQMLSLWSGLWLKTFRNYFFVLAPFAAFAWAVITRSNEHSSYYLVAGLALSALSVQQLQILFTLQNSKKPVRYLYALELIGGALGCIFWYQFSSTIGFNGFVYLAIIGQLLFLILNQSARYRLAIIPVLLGVLFLVREPEPVIDKRSYKTLVREGNAVHSAWDPNAQVKLVEGLTNNHRLLFDGGELQSSIPLMNKGLEEIKSSYMASENFGVWGLDVVLPHYLVHFNSDDYKKAALISSVGGQEVLAARAFGAKEVWAIDINASAQKLVQKFRQMKGDLLFDDSVNIVAKDGRKFIEKTDNMFDVIQIYSAHNAAHLGALGYVLQPSSLVTKEAIAQYISKLNDNGILHVALPFYLKIRAGFELLEYPSETELPKHLLVIYDKRAQYSGLSIVSTYFKKSVWTEKEVNLILSWLAADTKSDWEILHNPNWSFTDQALKKQDWQSLDVKRKTPIRGATDDWPFTKLVEPAIQFTQVRFGIAVLLLVVSVLIFTLLKKKEIGDVLGLSLVLGITSAFSQNLLIIFVQRFSATPASGLAATYALCLIISAGAALLRKESALQIPRSLAMASLMLLFFPLMRDHPQLNFWPLLLVPICIGLQSYYFAGLLQGMKTMLPQLFWLNGLGFIAGFFLFNLSFIFVGLGMSVLVLGGLYLLIFFAERFFNPSVI